MTFFLPVDVSKELQDELQTVYTVYDRMLHYVVADLGLHCLPRLVGLNI